MRGSDLLLDSRERRDERRVDRGNIGAVGRIVAGGKGAHAPVVHAGTGGGLGGLLGGIAGALGGNAALISTIVGGFGKLGLSAEDAKRFAPVMFDFLKTKVPPDVVGKLEKALRG